jgi:type IV pilus assembly protein PilO
MNFVDELQNLDANDVGRWPLPFRVGVIVIVFVLVVALGIYFFIVKDKAPLLERAQNEEQELRLTFENKQRKAANYDAYKAQLEQIEQSFGTMLRQLPGETEIPSLIVDISQTGLAAGLQEKLFAALPRIVTLHNINITRESNEEFDNLSMEVTAQTYRYLDEEAQ